jgi:hypothetical protein
MNKRKNAFAIAFALLFASFSFSNFLSSPGAANIRNIQILQLIATGMLIGVALVRIVLQIKQKDDSKTGS